MRNSVVRQPPGRSSRRLRSLLLAAGLAVVPLAALGDDEPPANCIDDAMLVFDASGSMQRLAYSGETRLSLARAAAHEVVPEAASTRRMGLAVYGPGEAGRCGNVDVRLLPRADAGAGILAEIDALSTAGETPLTAAVEQAAGALPAGAGTIVVLTDGDENCGGDPCATGRRYAAQSGAVTIHVVGFRVGTAPRFRAACLAEETGGVFAMTDTLDELKAALRRVLTCPRLASADREPPVSVRRR